MKSKFKRGDKITSIPVVTTISDNNKRPYFIVMAVNTKEKCYTLYSPKFSELVPAYDATLKFEDEDKYVKIGTIDTKPVAITGCNKPNNLNKR